MKRVFIVALTLASVVSAAPYKPSEETIAEHRREVYALARDYIVKNFNLVTVEESRFNPVRFDSLGIWGDFEARIKELGDDRFEVQGWVHALGHDTSRLPWTVHLRYSLVDPEAWRYSRVDDVYSVEPEYLGWKLGPYWSIGYQAEYDDDFLAARLK